MNNLIQTMQLLTEIVAKRVGRKPDDLAVRTFAGVVVGVNISVMQYYAENPDKDFSKLIEEAFSKVEDGLPL